MFQFMQRHHKIHHVHMNRNLQASLCPWLVLGTLVTRYPAPVPTPEARAPSCKHSRSAGSMAALMAPISKEL